MDLSALAVSTSAHSENLLRLPSDVTHPLESCSRMRTGRLPLKTRAWGGWIFFFRLYGFVYALTIQSNSTLMLLFIHKNFFFLVFVAVVVEATSKTTEAVEFIF